MGEVLTVINAISAILAAVKNFSAQAAELGELVKRLQTEQRSMTDEEWKKVDAAQEAAREYAINAEPPTQTA